MPVPNRTPAPPALAELVDELDRVQPSDMPATAFMARHRGARWEVIASRPTDELFCWQAPDACDALAVVAAGQSLRAAALDEGASQTSAPVSTVGASPGASAPALRLAVAVDRSGRSASRLTLDGISTEEAPEGGRMLDTLLRCLGRPTPPAADPPSRLLAILWLSAIIEAAGRATAALTWPQTLRLHPASRLLVASGQHVARPELDTIVELAARTWTWEVLRLAGARRGSLEALCPAELAAWMDEGMYSRWVLGALPDPDALLGSALRALRPAAKTRLRDHIGQDAARSDMPLRARAS